MTSLTAFKYLKLHERQKLRIRQRIRIQKDYFRSRPTTLVAKKHSATTGFSQNSGTGGSYRTTQRAPLVQRDKKRDGRKQEWFSLLSLKVHVNFANNVYIGFTTIAMSKQDF